MKDNNNVVRFLLTFFLGWIGSLIINLTDLKTQDINVEHLLISFYQ